MIYADSNVHLKQADIAAVIALVRSGQHEAFSELMGRYDGLVRRTAYSILRNTEDAEDATQETFLRVLTKIHTFEGASAFSTWLTRIAINTALMRLRQRRTKSTSSLEAIISEDPSSFLPLRDFGPSPEQQCAFFELREYLHEAVRRLPATLRDIALEQLCADVSVQELADKRGLSVAAAKSRLYRARKLLHTTLRTVHTEGPKRKAAKPLPLGDPDGLLRSPRIVVGRLGKPSRRHSQEGVAVDPFLPSISPSSNFASNTETRFSRAL